MSEWLLVESVTLKELENYERIFVYTPTNDVSMRYRVIAPQFLVLMVDATHWMPATQPLTNGEN